VSEPAAELPISDARDHLADVVNRAVYAGEPTYLTRRGRRLAVVASPATIAADQAEAARLAVASAARQMWADAQDRDEATQAAVRAIIDRAVQAAEDAADLALIAESRAAAGGAEPEDWQQVKAELGL